MAERAISEAWFHRIKAATRDLVKACGGIERAAEIASMSRGHMGRFHSPGDEDIITISAALALEAECGRPYVTRVMADLNGRGLTDPEASSDITGCVDVLHNAAMSEFVELTAEILAAKADGQISPAEAEMVDRRAADVERAMADLRRKLAAKKAGGNDDAGVTRFQRRGA